MKDIKHIDGIWHKPYISEDVYFKDIESRIIRMANKANPGKRNTKSSTYCEYCKKDPCERLDWQHPLEDDD